MIARKEIEDRTWGLLSSGIETEADLDVAIETIVDLRNRKAEVWGLPDNALVSRVFDGPEGRFMELGPAAGNLQEIFALAPAVEAWARAAGCKHIDVSYSRPGWERGLKQLGYEKHDDVMRKQLPWA